MGKVYVIQHQDSCRPGWTLEWAQNSRLSVEVTRIDLGQALPNLESPSDLIIGLGGNMNVDQEKEFPWLKAEKKFLEEVLRKDRAYLGICLGAQLMTEVLGQKVYLNKQKEIGWHRLELTPAGQKRWDETSPIVFHWHECVFDLPQGAELLAKTAVTPNQAYAYKNTLNLQFHPEVTEDIVDSYLEDWDEIEGGTVQPESEIRTQTPLNTLKQKNLLFAELDLLKRKLL